MPPIIAQGDAVPLVRIAKRDRSKTVHRRRLDGFCMVLENIVLKFRVG